MQPYFGILYGSLSGLWISTLSVLTLAAATSITGPAAAQKASGASENVKSGAVNDGLRGIFRQRNPRRETVGQQNANAVTIVTGAFGSTYVQIGVDLANVLNDGANFRLLPIMGRGSVQTIADILFLKGVDVGIVRRDALAYLERKGYTNSIRNQLAYVTKLYNEEMHVVASRSIRSMQDLDGRKVAVDLLGGGTFVTSMNVFEGLGIKPNLLYIESRVALEMLRKGEIDAIVAVEGKPLLWLAQLPDKDLHLVPIDYARSLRDNYLPAEFSSEDYPNLIAQGEQVDTIATDAILMLHYRQPDSDRYGPLSRLVEAFFSQVTQLHRPQFHPKWRELALQATVAGLTRFKPAQDWLDRNVAPAAATAALFRRFGERADARGVAAEIRPEEYEAIFREFQLWGASQSTGR